MDLRRVRVSDWLTGLAGLVLLVALFLPWYSVGASDATGWEALTVIDVVLALAALMGLALPLLAATQRAASVPQSWTALVVPFATAAALLAIIRLLDLPGAADGREAGVWLAAASAIALLALDWRTIGDDRFPRAMRPPLDVATIPVPRPDGERRDLP